MLTDADRVNARQPTQAGTHPAVGLRGIVKRHAPRPGRAGGHLALGGIDLDVAQGRFVTLVGPNGCGKSTLLDLVAGLSAPTSGSITVHGEPLRGLNRHAAYLVQRDALLPWKSALDNVVLALIFRGHDKRAAADLGREWLHRVGLSGFADHYPYQLSGGMRRRVAIAQSWISDADIVLMDEPFSALDSQTRNLTECQLLELWTTAPRTVLLVTHDLTEAVALSDEVILLGAGPGSRIVGRYPVDLPRPRLLDELPYDPNFSALCRTIATRLRAEVMASHEPDR